LAEQWGAICAPPVYYTFPGASGPWPGAVDVSPNITQEYLKEIARAFLRGRFKRIVFCAVHAPLRWMLENVVRSIFQETGRIVLALAPKLLPKDLMTEKLGYGGGEDVSTLAALRILGLHGAYDPAADVEQDIAAEAPFESLVQLWDRGAWSAWTFSRDHQHTGIRKGLKMDDADKVVEVMKQAAVRLADLPDLFAQFQRDMELLHKERPWDKDDIWTV
jgi:creatinine amidohydrolase/Fe(II)-dependent formamide hydrolase-like protein